MTVNSLDRLRLGTGFGADELDGIVDRLGSLEVRLRGINPEHIDMELSVKERNGADQHVTLELWIAGRDRLVATSTRPDMAAAVQEVRDDMVRQLNDSLTREEASRR